MRCPSLSARWRGPLSEDISGLIRGESGPDETGDRVRRFLDLLGRAIAAFGQRLADTVAEVLLEQTEGDRLERLGGRRDLREDVDAVLVLLDHPLQAPDLAL